MTASTEVTPSVNTEVSACIAPLFRLSHCNTSAANHGPSEACKGNLTHPGSDSRRQKSPKRSAPPSLSPLNCGAAT